jgi:hypothetical protein
MSDLVDVRSLSRLAMLVVWLAALYAHAEPLRLRGEALGQTRSPVGLLVLEADARERPWLAAEALVWTGAGDEAEADALVVAVTVKDPRGRGQLRAGRLVLSTGAVRPLHMDGAWGVARHRGVAAEAFGGSPVVPRFGERSYDWLAGGRVSWAPSPGTIGVSFVQQRDEGRLADEEVGVDLSTAPLGPVEGSARAAYDLVQLGLADVHASVALRSKPGRAEVFVSHRSLSRILPATSLFTVLGDAPATTGGLTIRWWAAPRLDVLSTAAARRRDDDVHEDLSLALRLRLDDRGDGLTSLEVRRLGGEMSAFTGVRGTLRVPIGVTFAFATEVELAVPDEADGRGEVWPWALAALTWRPDGVWEAAVAVEAMSSPELRHSFQGLFRLSRRWEGAR